MKNQAHRFLAAVFLSLIFGVGAVQAVLDLWGGGRPRALDLFTQPPTEAALRAYEKGLEDGSWFEQQARPLMTAALFFALGDAGDNAVLGHGGWFFYRPGVQYLTRPLPRFDGSGDPVDAITASRDRLAERGIRLLVVPAPNKETVYPERLTRRAEGLSGAVNGNTREILARLARAGVETVDLAALYAGARRAQGDDPSWYLPQDTHWSPRGVALAARAVADRLTALGWTAPGGVEYAVEPAPTPRAGDVPRMMRAPLVEAACPAEPVPCERITRRDTGEPYADDPASEVLVLGDSFLRIYQRDDPGAAGFTAHLARALGRPLASVINDGGASTLVRQELSRRPELLRNAKVVVWEFTERDIRHGMEGWQDVPLPPAR